MPRRASHLARWLTPSLLDCLLVCLLLWQFAVGGRWAGLLADGDTGWHIRTGEYILEHGQWPRTDLFSFSKAGGIWYAWEWLAEVVFALLNRLGGLSAVAAGAALVIVSSGVIVFRRMYLQQANVFLSMVVLMLAMGAASIHFLARPHVFTLLLWPAALWIVERDRIKPSPWLWALAPLTAVWTNLHGGFTALMASLVLLALGRWAELWLAGGAGWERFKPALRYGALLGACGAASLVNPYGWRLHLHIAGYLRSGWIRNVVDEFQSPKFRSEHSLHFELLLFAALMAAAAIFRSRRIAEGLLIIFWAHAALVSARHVPLFVFLVAPAVAGEASRLWRQWVRSLPANSPAAILEEISRDMRPGFARLGLWSVAGAALVIATSPQAHWPKDFPAQKFPVELVGRQAARLAGARVFTSDQWADYLIYRFYPHQKVYMDGRSDFYGPEIGDEYLRTVQGRPGWPQVLDRWQFRFALAPKEWPLAHLLEQQGGWRRVDGDKLAVLYERVGAPPPA